jgi:hypothetical protein
MREFAGVGPDVRLQVGLLDGLVSAVREWTCVHTDQGSGAIWYIKYEYLQGLIVFIVRAHMSRKIRIAAYSFVADRAVNRRLQRTRHKYKPRDVR